MDKPPQRPRKPTIRALVFEFLESERPAEIDPPALQRLRRRLQTRLERARPPSERYLLDILSETGIPIARSLGGLPRELRGRVHFHDEQAAKESLLELQGKYERARQAGERQRAEDCRRAVRQARDRLRLLLANPKLSPEKRAEKQELLEWFLVWLETPELFESWLRLRQAARQRKGVQAPHPDQ